MRLKNKATHTVKQWLDFNSMQSHFSTTILRIAMLTNPPGESLKVIRGFEIYDKQVTVRKISLRLGSINHDFFR